MKECTLCGHCLEDHFDLCPEDGAPLAAPFAGSALLDQRYRLLRRIGGGGSSSIYRARHLGLERLVAVKVLRTAGPASEAVVSRFVAEAKALARLAHPAVIAVFDAGVERERWLPYVVLELLEGESLAARLAREGPLRPRAALPILEGVARALDASHSAGILHRDLKPANVMLVAEAGAPPKVKVVDFGLAELVADLEATPAVTTEPARLDPAPREPSSRRPVGTPGYIAPEVLAGGAATPASDLYSFGALAYQTLTGAKPGPSPEPPSVRAPGLPAGLDEPLLSLLAAEPAARPASACAATAAVALRLERFEDRQHARRALRRAALLAPAASLLLAWLLGLLAPYLTPLERRTVDLRLRAAAGRPADPRILLVTLDEETLRRDPAPLVDRADEMGRLLARCLEAGARGVAIDLLLPASWSRSAAFGDLLLRFPDRLALAAYTPPEGPVIGPEVVRGLTAAALGPERARQLFGDVNVELDPDGRLRAIRPWRRDTGGALRPAFAMRAAGLVVGTGDASSAAEDGMIWLDARIDWQRFETLPWHRLEEVLTLEPARLSGRVLLVGASFEASGDGPYHLAGSPEPVPGYAVQALLVQSMLDRLKVPGDNSSCAFLTRLSLSLPVVGLMMLRRRLGRTPSWAALALGVAWIAGALLALRWGWVLPLATPIATLPAAVGVGWLVHRWLTVPHFEARVSS